MTMLIRRKGVFQVLQRAFRNSSRQTNSVSSRPQIQALVESRFGSNRHFSAATSQFQIAVPKARESDDVKGPRNNYSTYESIDKLLHSVSLNVQRTGRVYVTDIIHAKRLIEESGTCSSSHALLLLRCGGELCVDDRVEERIETVDSLWSLFKKYQVPLDVSHYNALLRTYVENERQFSPTEFLSMMESENGIEPNRVTYQYLIARFCNLGDILGATTILEHMKEKDMTVNEHVFHSLIIGHCRNGDFDSAEGILKMMSESGVDVGSEAYVSLLRGMGRAGKSWEEISEKITEANNVNVALTDHDLFRIAIELIRSKNVEAARQAINAVPKARGFFQEMRNAVPQMIFAGDIDLAFDTLKDFKTPTISDENHKDAASKDHGLFFLRAMVKSEYPPEKVIEILEKVIKENGDVSNHACRLIDLCIDMQKVEYGSKLADCLREKFGSDLFNPLNFTGFFRSRAKRIKSEDELIMALKVFDSMKIQLAPSNVCNDVMPLLFRGSNILEPLKQLNKVLAIFSGETLSNKRKFFANCLIQYLLNLENKEGLYAVSRMSVFTNVPARPTLWSASLARSYLAVGDSSLLTTVFFNLNDHVQALKREKDVAIVMDQELFSTLVHIHGLAHRFRPMEGPDEVVMNILNEMKVLKLGIPEQTAELLRPAMEKTEPSGKLLDEMVEIYKDRKIHLSKDRVEKILNEQRTNLNNQLDSLLQKYDSKRAKGEIETPKTMKELERIQQKLISSNVPATKVSSDIIKGYIEEGNLEKVATTIESILKQNPDFHISAISISMIVNKLIEEGNVDDAIKLLKNTEDSALSSAISRSKKFITSYTSVGIELAKAGRDDEVISLLESINPEEVVFGMLMSNVNGIIVQYGSEKRSDMAQRVADILLKKNLVEKAGHITPLITAYLNCDDVEGAVGAFESLAKTLKKLPGKRELMEYLIQREDMERMQRVLDASISVIGEERSLYDLAMNFLSLGKTSQARKLLETPGLRYNHDKAIFICKHFVENQMLSALENFVFLSQSVFNCDREFMFTTLAKAYSDNCAKMHEVWVRMQEDGFVPSDHLKGIMAAPFVAKEKPIPFHVPLEELQKTESRKKKKVELPEGAPSLKERYAAFDTAIEKEDLNNSILEFLSIAESGTYIGYMKVRLILELCCKKSAWKEASNCIKATLKRDLAAHVSRSSKAVRQVLDNLGDRDLESINKLITDEKLRATFDMEVRMRRIIK